MGPKLRVEVLIFHFRPWTLLQPTIVGVTQVTHNETASSHLYPREPASHAIWHFHLLKLNADVYWQWDGVETLWFIWFLIENMRSARMIAAQPKQKATTFTLNENHQLWSPFPNSPRLIFWGWIDKKPLILHFDLSSISLLYPSEHTVEAPQ